MKKNIKIGLIGDYDASIKAHQAIPNALKLASEGTNFKIEYHWISTSSLVDGAAEKLKSFQGLWCVPGSPYISMNGALIAIRFARENKYPFLGTCAGFQHTIIEYARNVLKMTESDHMESNPDTTLPLIAPLPCSLSESAGNVTLTTNSRIHNIYKHNFISEEYNCNFGINPIYQPMLINEYLQISGVDDTGNARVIELQTHPFFIATLFQPERSAFKNISHPLIASFVQAASCV